MITPLAHSVNDNQNLDTLVFCFTFLTANEAPVLFGVFTNLTYFYVCLFFAEMLLTQIFIFPIMHSPTFLFIFLLSLLIDILILQLSIIYCSHSLTYLDS